METHLIAAYIGNEFVNFSGHKSIITGNTLNLAENFSKPNPQFWLLLTPLEKITDEHLRGLWELTFDKPFPLTGNKKIFAENYFDWERIILMSGVERFCLSYNGDTWADSDLHSWKKHSQTECTNYLRKNGFDCDNLIRDGWAIDKTLKA